MMRAAPPQSPTPEIETLDADVTGSCLNNGLDDLDDRLFVQQQVDDETLQLIGMLAALPEQTHYSGGRCGKMTTLQVMTSQSRKHST